MKVIDVIKGENAYTIGYTEELAELEKKAKELCYEFNQTSPSEDDKRSKIIKELVGTYDESVHIEPTFRCDYGFNIHFHGFALINYNCVILDTSPVHIGKNAFIAPGVCIACAGHSIHPEQRIWADTSAPITLEDNVWIGANATICGGVTIGEGSVIGAGSVVVKDIPKGVVAAGNPCRVIRKITEKDIVEVTFKQE